MVKESSAMTAGRLAVRQYRIPDGTDSGPGGSGRLPSSAVRADQPWRQAGAAGTSAAPRIRVAAQWARHRDGLAVEPGWRGLAAGGRGTHPGRHAVRFSLLLSAPVILAAGVLKA